MTKNALPSKTLVQIWWSNQSFPDQQKLREFSTTKPSLQEMLKELPHVGNTREGVQNKPKTMKKMQIVSPAQFSRSVVSDSATPWTAARQASLSIPNSQSSLKLMSIESVMPSSHLILCHPLLLLPSIFPSIRVFSRVSSSHQVAKVLGFQLQHQSSQWTPRTDLL